ncbi:hypothetical protein [Methylobacterium sp. A54F]
MQASECCIIRVSIAAILGALVAFALLLKHGFVFAMMLTPLAGSSAAVGAIALFWLVSLVIPCPPSAEPDAEAV